MKDSNSLADVYLKLTPESKKLSDRAHRVLPSGITHDSRYQKPYGLYISHAKGSRKWDVDGNEYVDYVGGHGGHILGHSSKTVVDAVNASIARGTQLGGNTADEVEYAELVKEMVPCAERVRFTMSGTEATHLALRLARAHTGKSKCIRFKSHFHGWHDGVASGYSSHFDGGTAIGIPSLQSENTVLLNPGDINQVEQELERNRDIASIILEPTGTHFGMVPLPPSFLQQLRELTSHHKVVLIFDEVITGFRVAPGGAQEALGVTPDMSTHAKIIAGGLPGGAVCGKKAILDELDFDAMNKLGKEKVQHNGTFNANLVSAQAGIAVLKEIRDSDVCHRANRYAEKLRSELNNVLHDRGLNWAVYGSYSGFFIFTNPNGRNISPLEFNPLHYDHTELKVNRLGFAQQLVLALIVHGVHIAGFPGGWVSGVHTEEDLNVTHDAFSEAIAIVSR